LKRNLRGSNEPQNVDPDLAEAWYEDESIRQSSRRQGERKTRQFCRQVQRALNLAIADRSIANGLDDMFVEKVLPAPDCGRLLVHVVIPAHRPMADAIHELGRETPRLRSEVAMAITRKRAPELCFLPAYSNGGNDE
jgi:ribosome-binding factor A